jgi:hypothetical protein
MAKFSELPHDIKYACAMAHGCREPIPTDDQLSELDAMTPRDLFRLWTQHHLGGRAWADEIVFVWEKVSK